MVHTCNPSTLGGRGRRISEFEASLAYRVSFRTARVIQRNPVSKKQKQNKTKKNQPNKQKNPKKQKPKNNNKKKQRRGHFVLRSRLQLSVMTWSLNKSLSST